MNTLEPVVKLVERKGRKGLGAPIRWSIAESCQETRPGRMDDCCPLCPQEQSIAARTPVRRGYYSDHDPSSGKANDRDIWPPEHERSLPESVCDFLTLYTPCPGFTRGLDGNLAFQILIMSSLFSPLTCSGVSEKLWSPLQLKAMLSENEAAVSSSTTLP